MPPQIYKAFTVNTRKVSAEQAPLIYSKCSLSCTKKLPPRIISFGVFRQEHFLANIRERKKELGEAKFSGENATQIMTQPLFWNHSELRENFGTKNVDGFRKRIVFIAFKNIFSFCLNKAQFILYTIVKLRGKS